MRFVLIGIGVVMCLVLNAMNRVWWCEQGDWLPWSFDVWSSHNSQHLFDPYALSHFGHGVGLWLVLALVFRDKISATLKVIVIAVIEAGWEILENTPLVIGRYRESTVSLDYTGDSISNSVSDYLMCLAGVYLVQRISWRAAITTFVVLEVASLIWIRDSLLINIMMLTYPIDPIRQWQSVK
jgi:hypothetical protein